MFTRIIRRLAPITGALAAGFLVASAIVGGGSDAGSTTPEPGGTARCSAVEQEVHIAPPTSGYGLREFF